MPDTPRPVWLTEDDHTALRYILKGSPGDAEMRDWAMSMCERYHAAPADPAEAAEAAIEPLAFDDAKPMAAAVLRALGFSGAREKANPDA